MYIVRAQIRNADVMYYTGRAGDHWLSPEITEAFIYLTHSEARIKAQRFNRQHDAIRFEAARVGEE
jgi:hypothetical protein